MAPPRALALAVALLTALAAAGAAAAAWSPAKVKLPAAQRLAASGGPVVVAVIDSGVDATDQALRGAFVAGHDFVGDAPGSERTDALGHGTAVAAVVAGRSPRGACPRCLVMPLRVVGASGTAKPADVAAAIEWSVAAGARVINVSLATTAPDAGLAAAVQDALAHGVVVVAGAGNAGTDAPDWPAAYPGVISVAATDAHDAREPWSNYGSWVDVAAPGCNSTRGARNFSVTFCGTSSATALVSGIIGLALSAHPAATPADIASALAASSSPVGSFVRWGRVDASSFVRALARQPLH